MGILLLLHRLGKQLQVWLCSLVMLIGYAIIAVPTGIITAELTMKKKGELGTQVCPHCMTSEQDIDSIYCKRCGRFLNP